MEKLRIISRPKLNRLGRHYGVMFDESHCIHMTRQGIEKCTLEDFLHGHDLKIEKEVPLDEKILKRLRYLGHKKVRYAAFRFNCESFAHYLLTGRAHSQQIRKLTITLLAVSGAYLLWRLPLPGII